MKRFFRLPPGLARTRRAGLRAVALPLPVILAMAVIVPIVLSTAVALGMGGKTLQIDALTPSTVQVGQTLDLVIDGEHFSKHPTVTTDDPTNITWTQIQVATGNKSITLTDFNVGAGASAGVHTITVTDDKGAQSDSATLTVTVASSAPIADAQSLSTAPGVALQITLTGSDSDSDPLTFAVTSQPSDGALTGAEPNLTYTPNDGYVGTDAFTFEVDDGNGGTDSAQVTISVVLAAPTIDQVTPGTIDQGDVDRKLDLHGDNLVDAGLTISFAPPAGAPGSGDEITVNSVTVNASGKKLSLDVTVDAAAPLGVWTITVVTLGGSAPASLTIATHNQTPVAAAVVLTTPEDMALDLTLSGSDADGDPLSFLIVDAPLHGVVSGAAPDVNYSPDADYNGDDSFTVTVSDGQASSAPVTVSIAIMPLNDAPVAMPDAAATTASTAVQIDVIANDTDVDNDPLSVTAVAPGSGGTVAIAGASVVVYTPAPGFAGSDSFSYTVADAQGGVATGSVTVQVSAPVVVPLPPPAPPPSPEPEPPPDPEPADSTLDLLDTIVAGDESVPDGLSAEDDVTALFDALAAIGVVDDVVAQILAAVTEEPVIETTVDLSVPPGDGDPDAGAPPVVSLTAPDGSVSISVPPQALADHVVSVSVSVRPVGDVAGFLASIPPPPGIAELLGGAGLADVAEGAAGRRVARLIDAFSIVIADESGSAIRNFARPLTLIFQVDLSTSDARALAVLFFDTSIAAWVQLPASVDQSGAVTVLTDHLSLYAIMELPTVQRTLGAGWNLLTFTGADGTPVADVARGIGPALQSIWRFDAASQRWLVYQPGVPEAQQSLRVLRARDALFIKIAAGGSVDWITIDALPSPGGTRTVTLSTGWNSVGFSGANGALTADLLAPIASVVRSVWLFDGANQRWVPFFPDGPARLNRFDTIDRLDGIFLYNPSAAPIAFVLPES